MGGIGKTALSVKLAQQIVETENQKSSSNPKNIHQTSPPSLPSPFQYLIWRSLRNAPLLETLLSDLIPFLSNQRDAEVSQSCLMHWLRSSRCLVILDNLETILQSGDRAGYYRPGYENYGELFRIIGETSHQSCVILTSREKPTEIASLEGDQLSVRSIALSGSLEASEALIQANRLVGSAEQKQRLCQLYGCNPLALRIVSTSIRELFSGEIAEFLAEDVSIFNGVRRLLDHQFDRLSPLEQSIMYWLAINREWTPIAELANDIIPPVNRIEILEALKSLSWRSLIEKNASRYTQQPVVMEYVIDRLIRKVCAELITTTPTDLFQSHALLKTTVKDYIQETQIKLIIEPIATKLQANFSSQKAIDHFLQSILKLLRDECTFSGYAGGNLINLCNHLHIDLAGYDFSHLSIWHADLRAVNLHQVSFQNADFTKSVFTQIFESILCVEFSPKGEWLAAGDTNGEVHLWQMTDNYPFLTCKGHTNWVLSVAFSPDGHLLASGSEDHTIRLWDVATGQILRVLHDSTRSIASVAFSPDGRILAGSEGRTVRLWDVMSGQIRQILQGHPETVTSVAFSPDGQYVATGSHDRTIRLWDVHTGNAIQILQGHTNRVWSVAFMRLPLKLIVVSGSEDQTVRLWDVETGQTLKVLHGHTKSITSVAASLESQRLASGSHDQTVRLWDTTTGQALKTLQGYTSGLQSIVYAPDGQRLASGSHDRTVRVWDVASGQVVRILQGHSDWVRSVAFSPDGQRLASGSGDHTVRLWDVQTGELIRSLEGHHRWVWSVGFSPDSTTIASGSLDQTINLWDVQTGRLLKTLHGHTAQVASISFSPDGRLLASGGGDHQVKIWDACTGQVLHTLTSHTSPVWSIAFSPDGQFLASGGDHTVKLWQISTGNLLNTLKGHTDQVVSVSFSSDGIHLASGSLTEAIKIWHIQTGECLKTLRAAKPYEGMMITGIRGLTEAQIMTLKALGAVE